jgi:hypothetical protein
MQATVEVDKKRNQVNSGMDKQLNEAKAQNKVLMESQKLNHNMANKKLGLLIDAEINKEKNKK